MNAKDIDGPYQKVVMLDHYAQRLGCLSGNCRLNDGSTIYDMSATPDEVKTYLLDRYQRVAPLLETIQLSVVPFENFAGAFVKYIQEADGELKAMSTPWIVENQRQIEDEILAAKRRYGRGPIATDEDLKTNYHAQSGQRGPTVTCTVNLMDGDHYTYGAYAADIVFFVHQSKRFMIVPNAQIRNLRIPVGLRGTFDFFVKQANCPWLLVAIRPHRPDLDCRSCQSRPEILSQVKLCGGCKKAAYCCSECQVDDWPSHKEHCKASKKKTKSTGATLEDPKREKSFKKEDKDLNKEENTVGL